MKYSDKFTEAIKRIQSQDGSPAQAESCMSPFWEMVIENICEIIRTQKDLDTFLIQEQNFINFGIIPELCQDPQKVSSEITSCSSGQLPVQVLTMTAWISSMVYKIMKGDKEEILIKKIAMSRIGIKKAEREIAALQQDRKTLLISLLEKTPTGSQFQKYLNIVEEIDSMVLESLRVKKSVSNGAFLSVEQKRVHFEREKKIQKENQWYASMIGSIKERDGVLEAKKSTDKIVANFNVLLDYEFCIEKSEGELERIKKEHQEISPLEIQSKIRKELERMRDLVRLSARRLHCDSVPLITKDSKCFTYDILKDCFDRILEFDPKIYQNDRVTIFGRPSVLLVPGSGNAMYDWENNLFVVPFSIPGGNAMASVASGVIEYRLDVDESRYLLTTYNQLSDNKNIRSSTVLKSQLVKDYITWMTSEYKGYRILKKDSKQWFEHELAPNKMEIFTPPSHQIFALSKDEYQKQLSVAEEKIKDGLDNCSDQDIWIYSILYYQKGELADALRMLQFIAGRNKAEPMVYYNIGQIASKLNMRQVAQDGFTEYIRRNPQSWWAKNAQERISRL